MKTYFCDIQKSLKKCLIQERTKQIEWGQIIVNTQTSQTSQTLKCRTWDIILELDNQILRI